MYAHLPTYLETTFPGGKRFQRGRGSDSDASSFVPPDSFVRSLAASLGSARRSSATHGGCIQHGFGFGDDDVAAPSTWQRVERRR